MTATSVGYRLTQYAHGGGCACKIPPRELEETLAGLSPWTSPDLLVGLDTGDDAAVVRIDHGQAVISTADFFTPVTDDAYDFGRVAAANALSDIFAMGGRPLCALNLMGIPNELVPPKIIATILRGGLEKAREVGCAIVGGHTIRNPEPVYGLAVTGIVSPKKMLTNCAGKPGDLLVLTKLLTVFETYDDEAEAIASFKK